MERADDCCRWVQQDVRRDRMAARVHAWPAAVIDKMTMLQQYTFVCAPHPLQWAAVAALDVDMSEHIAAYRRKRDRIVAGLTDADYKVARPGGAFYVFPEVPQSTGGLRQ